MKEETRGRKYSGGRVRTKTLSAKFTEKEKADILAIVKESGLTQSDFLIKATDYYEINTTKNREVK